MNNVRRKIFETNSSSTHSITMCTGDDFDKWVKGELYLHKYKEKFFTPQEVFEEWNKHLDTYGEPDKDSNSVFNDVFNEFRHDYGYQTYEEWEDDEWLENYIEEYTTPGGEKVVAFGQFGYDG